MLIGRPVFGAQLISETVPFASPGPRAPEKFLKDLVVADVVAERQKFLAVKYGVALDHVIPLSFEIRPRIVINEQVDPEQWRDGEDLHYKMLVQSDRIHMDRRYVLNVRFVATDGRENFAELDFSRFPGGTFERFLKNHGLAGPMMTPIAKFPRSVGVETIKFLNSAYTRLELQRDVKIEAIFSLPDNKIERITLTPNSAETKVFLDLALPQTICQQALMLRHFPARLEASELPPSSPDVDSRSLRLRAAVRGRQRSTPR